MNCPVLLQYPDEFIPNTKVVQNRSTNPVTQPTRVSDVHDTPGLIFPPPDTLSGNHPEPVLRPRINSRSEQYTVYRVRAPLTLCFPCDVFILLALPCIYCFFPLFYCPVVSTTDADAPVFDYVDDDRTPTIELPGKQSYFPSPTYRLLFYIFLLH